MNNLIAEANVSEGTFIQREMTESEIERDLFFQKLAKEQNKKEEIESNLLKEEKMVLLNRLGITEEEAKLLLG